MKYEKRHFVVVLPGDIRVFKDLEIRDERSSRILEEVRSMAQQVVWGAKLTTPRKNPQTIKVKVYEQTIREGKISEAGWSQFDIQPLLEPMTGAEYAVEVTEVLTSLPHEFHNFVSQRAEGHSSYEERIQVNREIVESLEKAITSYRNRNQ